MHYNPKDESETFKPQYLYLEDYPIRPLPNADREEDKEDDSDRGVIIIDIL